MGFNCAQPTVFRTQNNGKPQHLCKSVKCLTNFQHKTRTIQVCAVTLVPFNGEM